MGLPWIFLLENFDPFCKINDDEISHFFYQVPYGLHFMFDLGTVRDCIFNNSRLREGPKDASSDLGLKMLGDELIKVIENWYHLFQWISLLIFVRERIFEVLFEICQLNHLCDALSTLQYPLVLL